MNDVLLIEDEEHKREQVAKAIFEAGIDATNLDVATDVVSAKKFLAQRQYQLVILDINLPLRADETATAGGGLEILRSLKLNRALKQPRYLVGLTAYDDGQEAAKGDFAQSLWKILRYSNRDIAWKNELVSVIKEVCLLHSPPYPADGQTFYTDLAIFTALEEELHPVLAWDIGWVKIPVSHDPQTYWLGKMVVGDRTLSIVATSAPRMGLPIAAVVATKLISNFKPALLASVGICAGVRGRTDIGDVLASDVCWDVGSGKWIAQKDGVPKFKPAPYQWTLDADLRKPVADTTYTSAVMGDFYSGYKGKRPGNIPKVLVNATASGASVLQSEAHMQLLIDQHKNVIGLEMESYGVFTAAELAFAPRPRCISIKAVCDFGDGDKSDDHHSYAAAASANLLERLCKDCFAQLLS